MVSHPLKRPQGLTLSTSSTLPQRCLQPCPSSKDWCASSWNPSRVKDCQHAGSWREVQKAFLPLCFFPQIFIFSITVYKHRLFIIRRRYSTHATKRYSMVQSKVQSLGIILFQVPGFTGKSMKNNWCKSSPTISPLIFRSMKKTWKNDHLGSSQNISLDHLIKIFASFLGY